MGSEEARGEMTIRREERKLERAKAKAEAYEKNMTDTIAAFLKDERNKKSIAQDAIHATKDSSRREEMTKYTEGYRNDDEIITGREPRPWER
jgi:hypothetical protein